jgi:hypothetical protein
MKKLLLLLFIASVSFGQNVKLLKPTSVIPITQKRTNFNESIIQNPSPINPNNNSKTSSINLFTGSMNVYGYVFSHSRPLQYNPALNAVSMFARKNGTYTASSNSNSGTIVGLYSTDMGTTWNETCVWSNSTYFAHYPNGGIYNPIGNTNINNAYLVGAGPLNNGTGWVGNWYASKQITTPGNNTPGVDQQAMINSSLPAGMSKHHFSRSSFTAIDGGKVRSLGIIANDPDATTKATFGMRGTALLKGTFTAGSFVWSIDTFIPKTTTVSIAAGGPYKNLSSTPLQAWDESGIVGYIVMIGSRATETINPTNVKATGGMQPIVYKTNNGGASWALLPPTDFADSWCYGGVYDRTYPIATNTNIVIANFSGSEGCDVTVDANGQLHIATMLYGHTSNHVDSLDYRYTFGFQQYSYGESGPFYYPAIYDFYTLSSFGYCYHVIDSMGTEGPSGILGQPGYTTNLWSDGSTGKLDQGARIQMSRSADGTKIFYTWTETDTTVAGHKWNIYPNLKLKGFDINMKKVTPRYDLTSPDVTHSGSAYYHYLSNKAAGSSGTYTIPCTTTKNSTRDGSVNVDTYFINNAVISSSAFSITAVSPAYPISCCVPSNVLNIANGNGFNISSFPNPANNAATIAISLKAASTLEITLYNTIGRLMDTYKLNGQIGANEINVDLSNFKSGIYFYNVKVGNSVTTKKLVVQ